MIVEIRSQNPDRRAILEVVNLLNNGGLIILPTDTIYAAACKINNIKALESFAKKLGKKSNQTNFSILCHCFSQLSEYTKPISNPIFKLMKQVLPGPFTFILKASHKLPHSFRETKKTIGIRVPNNLIVMEILKELGEPLLVTSIHNNDLIIEYHTDPYEIETIFGQMVAMVIDGGMGGNIASTVIDCTDNTPQISRQGKGII